MSDYVFRSIVNLVMCSDPTPIGKEEDDAIQKFLDSESIGRGFDGWIDAYHRFKVPGEA